MGHVIFILPFFVLLKNSDKIPQSFFSISASFITKFAEDSLPGPYRTESYPNPRREESQKLVCRHAFWER